MKINKEKLIKYIRDNIISSRILCYSGEGTLLQGVDIETKVAELQAQQTNCKYLLRVRVKGQDSENFEITKDTYNELMKFADKNLTPETQEFYKQICDEE